MGKDIIKQMVVVSILLYPLVQFSQHPDKREVAQKKQLASSSDEKLSHEADSAAIRKKYIKWALAKIRAIEADIAVLKAREPYKNSVAQQHYDSKVLSFENQKNELRTAVTRSGEIDKTKWATFKKDLNALLDSLGLAVKDLKQKST